MIKVSSVVGRDDSWPIGWLKKIKVKNKYFSPTEAVPFTMENKCAKYF